jgi:hypothetical protein
MHPNYEILDVMVSGPANSVHWNDLPEPMTLASERDLERAQALRDRWCGASCVGASSARPTVVGAC